jgi:predicted permease
MPRGFSGEVVGAATDIWLPLAAHDLLHPNEQLLGDRRRSWLLMIGRSKPGLTLPQVKQRLVPLIESSIMTNATSNQLVTLRERGLTYYVSSGEHGLSSVRPAFASPLIALMAGVMMLLAIVCVNVANLLLARGIARRREMLARLAIGASRWRIVRQLLAEGLLLAVVSALAAVVVAWWGSRALVALASEGEPISLDVGPNPRVLAFTIMLAMVSVVLFGLVPALRSSRVDLGAAMRAHGRSIAQGARFGVWLLAVQVAISLVLVTGASILMRGLHAVETLDLGLDRDHLIVADLDITTPGYSGDRLAAVVHAVRDRVVHVPGVTHVTYSENGLFAGTEWHSSVGVPGFTPRAEEDSSVATDNVGAGYAAGIGARIVAGRDFAFSDEGVPPRVAMVSAPFARFYFPGRSAVGQGFRLNDSTHLTIVGVIGDVRGQALEPPAPRTARRVYLPYLHPADPGHLSQPSELRLFVRTRGDPAPVVEAVRRAIVSADPALPINHVRPLPALVRASIRQERLVVRIATALGVLALSLAAIGLYGVAAYMVAQRTGELGLRRALGAPARAVAVVVARDVVRPVVLGAAIGIGPAFAAMRALERYLSVAALNAGSIAIALAVLMASAIVAGLGPAARAARIDPVVALRSD